MGEGGGYRGRVGGGEGTTKFKNLHQLICIVCAYTHGDGFLGMRAPESDHLP